MVPQDGFLFDATLADNVRYGRLGRHRRGARSSRSTELGLADWLDGLPHGLDTRVGQRGESLSAGERQLVALVRAYLADPDLLVLDEATSAVDPATEVRLAPRARAADPRPDRAHHRAPAVHRRGRRRGPGRSTPAGSSQRGPHADLVDAGGVYARLHASWSAQQRSA